MTFQGNYIIDESCVERGNKPTDGCQIHFADPLLSVKDRVEQRGQKLYAKIQSFSCNIGLIQSWYKIHEIDEDNGALNYEENDGQMIDSGTKFEVSLNLEKIESPSDLVYVLNEQLESWEKYIEAENFQSLILYGNYEWVTCGPRIAFKVNVTEAAVQTVQLELSPDLASLLGATEYSLFYFDDEDLQGGILAFPEPPIINAVPIYMFHPNLFSQNYNREPVTAIAHPDNHQLNYENRIDISLLSSCVEARFWCYVDYKRRNLIPNNLCLVLALYSEYPEY